MGFGENGGEVSWNNLLSEPEMFGYERDEAADMVRSQWNIIQETVMDRMIVTGCIERLAAGALRAMPEDPGPRATMASRNPAPLAASASSQYSSPQAPATIRPQRASSSRQERAKRRQAARTRGGASGASMTTRT